MKQKKDKKAPIGGEIIIYKSATGPKLKVHLEKETIWLTQKQCAKIKHCYGDCLF